MLHNISKYHIFLASKSPRRRELLKMLRIKFDTVVIGLKEDYPDNIPLEEVSEYLSNLKAKAYQPHILPDQLVITADTTVICNGRIMGKPKDKSEAETMLKALSGKTHRVVTGVTIFTAEQTRSFKEITEVSFAEIDPEDIRYYIDHFSPLDKAGAYGIQEWIGCVAVKSISGSFYNVMGLPIHRLYEELKKF